MGHTTITMLQRYSHVGRDEPGKEVERLSLSPEASDDATR